MNVTFVELPPFERYRQNYISDDIYQRFQQELLHFPEKGDLIQGTNGLRKIRIKLPNMKGKRAGGRIIYYYVTTRQKVLLIAGYNKNQKSDLTSAERHLLSNLVSEILELENE